MVSKKNLTKTKIKKLCYKNETKIITKKLKDFVDKINTIMYYIKSELKTTPLAQLA